MSTEPESDRPKTPQEELAQWAREAAEPRGRKLTFSEKCGIAWGLKTRGVTAKDARNAFALSAATVSWLKHCLQDGRPHYRDVWQEYKDLGPDRFAEKHYVPLHFRFKRVHHGLTHLDENQTDITPKLFGADRTADKFCGVITLPEGQIWTVAYRPEKDPPGYAIESADNPGLWHGAERLRGAEAWEPFRRSEHAYDAVYEIEQYENPRPRPGRPKQK